MSAVTTSRATQRRDIPVGKVDVAASTTLYGGTLICYNSSGALVDGSDATGLTFAGVAREDADNSDGAAGDIECEFYRAGVFKFVSSGLAAGDEGLPVYLTDNQTVLKTATSYGIRVGTIVTVDSATVAWVEIQPTLSRTGLVEVHDYKGGNIVPTTDDTVLKLGNGTLSLDVWLYGNVATDYALWDASASLLSFAGVAALGVCNRSIGASTAAAGTTTADAGVLPAGTAPVYPTVAADDTKGVRVHASDKVTGREIWIGNGVSNKVLKIYPPSGGTINGAAADAAFSSASGKGIRMLCLDSTANTWLAA